MGDSITHGSVCASYVDMLQNHLTPRGYVVVNAGINSNLAWNVRQRLNYIIRCNQDIVTVMSAPMTPMPCSMSQTPAA